VVVSTHSQLLCWNTCLCTLAASKAAESQGTGKQTYLSQPTLWGDIRHVTRQTSAHVCRPLVVIGKGAAYAQADSALRAFIDSTQLPFLATAMGRGVVPDRY